MRYLMFDLSEGNDGVLTLDAMASTRIDAHAAVVDQAQRVLNWAWRHWSDEHGSWTTAMSGATNWRSGTKPAGTP